MEQVAAAFSERCPWVPIWQQGRRMDDVERGAFVERFCVDGQGIGFAVLGGLFAEGVDLPGTRLVGAFIVTLGLTHVNAINEVMRQKLEQSYGCSFEYTYQYPGLRTVVHAPGNEVRAATIVHLCNI